MARAFISHSHEDKERFVDGFVQRLSAETIETWYDTTEVSASDILPERALNDGIPSCEVFVSVLSSNSLHSEWVRKELNVALIRQLKGLCRILPVVLDGVKVPDSVSDIVRVEIQDTSSYDSEFERIITGIRDPIKSGHGHRSPVITSVDRSQPPASRLLPVAPSRFVNRDREIDALNRVLDDSEDLDRPRVAVLNGMPGVGKSALAAHWSKSVGDRFPDGCLYVDFSPLGRGQNHDLSTALAGLLCDLGVTEEAVPATPDAQAAAIQRITSDKRLLLVADNVINAAQLKQAMPSGHGSVVVATANHYMDELAVEHEAESLEVGALDRIDSAKVLRELAGGERNDATKEDWMALSDVCGGLPLALAVTGARLRRHRTWTVREMIEDILSADDLLVAVAGDDNRSLKRALDATYRSFDDRMRRFYRRIGMFPGRTVDPSIAAVVAGEPYSEAVRMLGWLHDAHLVVEIRQRRYTVHQLIVAHMKAAFLDEEQPEESEQLATRIISWYCSAVRCADRAVAKDRLRLAPDEHTHSDIPPPELESPSSAYEWYMSERHNIQDVMRMAYDMAHCQELWTIAESLWLLFSARRLFADWQECVQLGVEAAQVCEHRDAEARFRSQLARLHAERGEHDRARVEMSRAMSLIEASENLMLRASITEFSGTCEFLAGDNEKALAAFDSACAQMKSLGSDRGVAVAELQRSRALMDAGDFSAALEAGRKCQTSFVQLGDEVNAAKAAFEMARASAEILPWADAVDEVLGVVDTLKQMGLAYHSALAHELAAQLFGQQERRAETARHVQAAYQLYLEIGHVNAERIESLLLADIA